MSYPGDPALASDVKQRILTTFRQTLDLAAKGSRQEALLGCDFILRLDPHFGPARTLQQLVQAGRSGPELAALFGGNEVAPPQAAPPPPPAAEPDVAPPLFEDLMLELPEDVSFAPEVAAAASASSQTLAGRLSRLLSERRFAEILAEAEQDKRALAAEPEARQVVDQARARLEAGPYVKTFVDSARQALQSGDNEEADRLIRKARVLDPDHPELLALDEAKKFYSDPDRSMGARRRGIEMDEELESTAPAPAQDLDLPEVDFSFAGMAQDDYSFASTDADAPSDDALVSAGAGEHSVRIEELLSTGQNACDRGEYQAAIDAWSRIFLIDIDHQEAARRIEKARQLKAEREREIEELFHEGVAKFDSGAFEAAESAFSRVLELSPGHLVALEYLEKIRERQVGAPLGPMTSVAGAAAGAYRGGDTGGSTSEGARAGARVPRENVSGEILVPPEPGATRTRGAEDRSTFAVAAKRRAAPARGFVWIGGAVLVLLVAGGWLLLRNRASLFPNSKEPLQAAAPASVDLIARAKALQAEGKTAVAIAQLRRLPPQEPQFAEAQSLISQWEALIKPAEPVPAGLPPEREQRRQELVVAAERACRDREFLRCDRALEKAAALAPLDAAQLQLQAQAKEGLLPLSDELKFYGDGDFDIVLNRLWRRRETEPANRDIRQLIVDSYYNLGVRDLQRGDSAAAADKFREALALDPADAAISRLQAFAIVYSQRNEDLLFEIFVRNLPAR